MGQKCSLHTWRLIQHETWSCQSFFEIIYLFIFTLFKGSLSPLPLSHTHIHTTNTQFSPHLRLTGSNTETGSSICVSHVNRRNPNSCAIISWHTGSCDWQKRQALNSSPPCGDLKQNLHCYTKHLPQRELKGAQILYQFYGWKPWWPEDNKVNLLNISSPSLFSIVPQAPVEVFHLWFILLFFIYIENDLILDTF